MLQDPALSSPRAGTAGGFIFPGTRRGVMEAPHPAVSGCQGCHRFFPEAATNCFAAGGAASAPGEGLRRQEAARCLCCTNNGDFWSPWLSECHPKMGRTAPELLALSSITSNGLETGMKSFPLTLYAAEILKWWKCRAPALFAPFLRSSRVSSRWPGVRGAAG